ncbi:MAG TPA: secretin N-terminal domain-containing protein [Opitutaceae bacterium]|jgi:type II secretory pathway component GspD/PulD (secretin)
MRPAPLRNIRLLAALAASLAGNTASSQSSADILGILRGRVSDFAASGQEARTVMEGLGAAYRFPVIVDTDVQGLVTFEVHNASLATIFEAICQPKGWSWEISPDGYLLVRRFITKIYPVDYLQLIQSGSSSASISLSQAAESTGTASTGALSLNGMASATGGAPQSVPAINSGGSSTLNVSQQNDADFWGHLEADLKSMLGEGEGLVVNRFAGIVQLKASVRTHRNVEAYLRRVLQRVGRQAHISVKVVEVDLNDQAKAGIDWSVAATSFGRLANSNIQLLNASTSTSGTTQIGSLILNPGTFSGTVGAGDVQAVISALSEQGNVRIDSKPEIAALNNQTAFVQVSEDQPFFSRASTTTINAGGVATAGSQPIVNTNYYESTVSFGNVLEITVQIADDLTTKLSLSPAITELKGTATSPDGQETAPITDTKRARTTVTLRNHETAIVGGFITETTGTDRRGLPILSDLPGIGSAFATTTKARSRTELVFFVTVNAEDPEEPRSYEPGAARGFPGGPLKPVVRIDPTRGTS